MSLSKSLKPGVPRRWLLMLAGVLWTVGGGMLIIRGVIGLIPHESNAYIEIPLGFLAGLVFYLVLFKRISKKHVNRILALKPSKPCMFSFFDVRGYIMMTIMISAGITLRKLNLVDPEILYTFYVCMGVPLLLSAIKFYYNWYIYNNSDWTHEEDTI